MRDLQQAILAGETLIFDGGMGTLMSRLGGSMSSSENNLAFPQVVTKAHTLYKEAGSQAITSNTFSLNGVIAAKNELSQEQAESSLLAAMELACAAAGDECWVLGDLGPTGEMLAPLGSGDPQLFREAFARQAELMSQYPIAAFIIETVFDLQEAQIIMNACREAAPDIPVLLSMTFSSLKRGGCTVMGHTAAKIAAAAEAGGALAVGANCGDLSPLEYAAVLNSMKEACSLPLLVQPNAGKPLLRQGEAIYPLAAEDFAAELEHCYTAGARLLGGCCGTTPAHIAAVAAHFGGRG